MGGGTRLEKRAAALLFFEFLQSRLPGRERQGRTVANAQCIPKNSGGNFSHLCDGVAVRSLRSRPGHASRRYHLAHLEYVRFHPRRPRNGLVSEVSVLRAHPLRRSAIFVAAGFNRRSAIT